MKSLVGWLLLAAAVGVGAVALGPSIDREVGRTSLILQARERGMSTMELESLLTKGERAGKPNIAGYGYWIRKREREGR